MSSAYKVSSNIEMFDATITGRQFKLESPSRSLLLCFNSLDPDSAQPNTTIGALIDASGPIVPGEQFEASILFWNDIGRVYATPGETFYVQYGSVLVGQGRVTAIAH